MTQPNISIKYLNSAYLFKYFLYFFAFTVRPLPSLGVKLTIGLIAPTNPTIGLNA